MPGSTGCWQIPEPDKAINDGESEKFRSIE